MRALFLFLIILFSTNSIQAGNSPVNSTATPTSSAASKLITGKVIDKISGEEIAGAEIQIGEKKIYSDLEGNFSAIVSTDASTYKIEAAINYISYNEACVQIDLYSYKPLVIEIVSK
jgi:endonuclease I